MNDICRNVVFRGFITGIIIFGLSCHGGRKSQSSGTRIDDVKRQDIVQRITVSGTVIPQMTSSIQPSFSGYIRKIYVKLGQQVAKDSPLVLISPTLEAAGRDNYPIRSPFNGTVVQVLKSEGEYMETGAGAKAVLRVDDLTRLFVSADVPEVDFPKIKKGQEVNIRVSPVTTRTYHGIVQDMALAATQDETGGYRNESKVVFAVKIEITDKDNQIRPGMSALVDIIPEKRTGVLALRHEFVYEDNQKYYVIRENGEKQDVEVGLQNEEFIEIVKGLSEGDRIRQVDFLSLKSSS